jgi:hypothetical protein
MSNPLWYAFLAKKSGSLNAFHMHIGNRLIESRLSGSIDERSFELWSSGTVLAKRRANIGRSKSLVASNNSAHCDNSFE